MIEIYQISPQQFDRMLGEVSNREVAMFAARRSAEILVGMLDSVPLAFIGLAPPTLISDAAYVWMIDNEAFKKHGVLAARYSIGVVETALLKYSRIYGHCFSPKSERWLRWLGAEFTSPTEFEIRRG
jgi:hypothetical protein